MLIINSFQNVIPFDALHHEALDTVVARQIRRALEMTGGKIHGPGGAGEVLGVNPNTLRYKMRKLGIPHGKNFKNKSNSR